MNDWLDYQGSGSSRACIAHYGVKGMKWDPSKLFGKKDKEELDDKKIRARIEQDDVDDYAVEKTWREKRSAEMDIERYTKQVEEIEKRIQAVENHAADIEAVRKIAEVASPLKAFQESTRREKNQKLHLEDLNKQLEYAKNGLSDAKRRLSIAQVKYDKYRQQRSKHTREYDGPYVNSVRHSEKGGMSTNDWLDYQGSGSSRAYANNTLSHASLVPTGSPQYDADIRLINAYAEKMKKLKSEYKTILNDYNRSMKSYYNYMNNAGSYEGIRASSASKYGHPLKATQNYEKWIWEARKKASDAKSEADSYHAQMKVNVDAQKKLLDDVKAIDVSAYPTTSKRNAMRLMRARSIFIPYEVVSYPNPNQRIKQSYFDMPTDEFIEHAAVPKPIANNNAYNSLNNQLDQLYKSTQDLINLARNLRTSCESMISAARNTKKNLTLAEGKYKMWETAYNKIDSDIDAANISDMQKTALRNKLERILDGAGEIDKINTGYEIDINMDTFNDLINNIQNTMRR